MKYCCEKLKEYHGKLVFLNFYPIENWFVRDSYMCFTNEALSYPDVIHYENIEINHCPFCGTELLKLVNKAEITFADHTA